MGAETLVREGHLLIGAEGIDIYVVACAGRERDWSGEEPVETLGVVLVSSGTFRRRVDGVEQTHDPVAAYVQAPGQTQQVAHHSGGDVCTVIVPSASALGALCDPARIAKTSYLVNPAMDLAHRMLLARSRRGADTFELSERAAVLAGGLLDSDHFHAARASLHDRRLAARVREALDADPPSTLTALARQNGVSTYRLSRAFRRVTGLSVTSYRGQLRVRNALARLAAGDGDLAGIAADVGFADQAHLTRTLRAYAGTTPGILRGILAPPQIV
jgi:AraC-like DNA-binding protein